MPKTVPITVHSTDMDADAIVNNAVYFTYFEQSRLEYLIALGIVRRPRPPGDFDRSFTLAKTSARYLVPALHRDVLLVMTRVAEGRQRSFSLAFDVVRQSDGRRIAEGCSAQVWLDQSGRPASLPEAIRERLLAAWLENCVADSAARGHSTRPPRAC